MIYRSVGRTGTICLAAHNSWLGLGHLLVGVRNHNQMRALFSERYGLASNRHYLHVGRWCFVLDTNWMNRRKGDRA